MALPPAQQLPGEQRDERTPRRTAAANQAMRVPALRNASVPSRRHTRHRKNAGGSRTVPPWRNPTGSDRADGSRSSGTRCPGGQATRGAAREAKRSAEPGSASQPRKLRAAGTVSDSGPCSVRLVGVSHRELSIPQESVKDRPDGIGLQKPRKVERPQPRLGLPYRRLQKIAKRKRGAE